MRAATPFPCVSGHWLDGARRRPSPHCDARPSDQSIELVVIHAISLPEGRYGTRCVDDLFLGCLDCTSHPSFADLIDVRVSSHLYIDRTGAVTQYVPFDQRSWHAGISRWCERDGCNDFSVGIELEGCDADRFTPEQYARLIEIVGALRSAYPTIATDAVVGHCDIAPGRKTDPGPGFDWALLRDALAERGS